MSSQEITNASQKTNNILTNEDKLTLLLFGNGTFKPTANMCRLVVGYIRQETDLSPMLMLKEQGHARQNWYLWQQEYPGFLQWWNRVIEDVIKEEYLSGMYLQLLKRARTHDTGAAKLIAQRYDPKYTERSQTDSRHSFAGYEPASAARSVERQRKALTEQAQGLQDGPGSTIDVLPMPEYPPIAGDSVSAPEPTIGVGPVSPTPTHAIQAQSQGNIEPQEQASNDENADTEQIKPIEGGAGGGL